MPPNLEQILELCRLCQQNQGKLQFADNNEFINKVFECTRIKINSDHMNLLPKTICPSCKLNIEEFFRFVQDIRLVDQNLQNRISEADELLQCPTDFPKNQLLEEPIKTSCESNRSKCPACPKTYARFKNLELHKRSHVNLFCSRCETMFDDTLAHKSHKCSRAKDQAVYENHRDGRDQILECDDSKLELLQSPTDFHNKQLKTSNESNRSKCPACPKTYARFKNLQLHKRSHVNLFCSNCETTFDDTLGRTTHKCSITKDELAYENHKDDCDISLQLRTNSSDTDNVKDEHTVLDKIGNKVPKKEWFEDEFSSDDREIKNEDNINKLGNVNVFDTNHERLAEFDVNRKIKPKGSHACEVCSEKFPCGTDLRAHQKIHGITFSCTYENCKKVCTSAYILRTHLMRHEGKMPFLCVTCGKGFTTKNSLNCHEKTHAKVKGYTCKECNIGFSVASNLRAHQKKHHEGVRFYCSQCTRAFITKCSLERHELVHTGVKEFKCGSCRAAFYTNKELLKHQRYHQGLRLYKCDQCFKTFFEKHHLTIHIRVHTGERPYACKVVGCGKSFTESQKLSRHVKARHPPVC